MKKLLLQFAVMLFATTLSAQWVLIENGLDGFPPTSVYPAVDTMVLSTAGGGVYKTEDNGENWVNVNGDLGNLFVNDTRSYFYSTEDGPYISFDQVNYINCSNNLPNTDVNVYYHGHSGDWWVGTNGDGLFISDDYTGPWTADNSGLSGDELIINDFGGYSDNDIDYSVLATDGGMFYRLDDDTQWLPANGGLSGVALKVNKITGVGSMLIIATDSGLYRSLDLTAPWTEHIASEKLNEVFVVQSAESSTGWFVFAFGENGFLSEDFDNWLPMEMGIVTGEVTAAQANSTDLFVGTTTASKSNRDEGGMYRIPLSELQIVGINNRVDNKRARLSQNFPNPFRNTTTINYSLKSSGLVNLRFYDAFGRELQALINEVQDKGNYTVTFNVDKSEGSMFYYSLYIDNTVIETRKMILIK